jgi:hypothetical protein
MNISAIDIKDLLESESALGLIFAQTLFIGREPSAPNNCVTIFDGVGNPPELTLGNDTTLEYPSINIQIRNTSYTAATTLATQIKKILHGRNNEVWTNTTYLVIKCIGGPALLDFDANNRARVYLNFTIMRKE